VEARPFPLPLRNALAALTIGALEDDAAAAALDWLAAPTGRPPPKAAARLEAVHLIDAGADALLAIHAPHSAAVAAHAARGRRAAAHRQRAVAGGGDPILRAVVHAAALWNEGLFFEVHEVLEEVWKSAAGTVRQALQGVIQIAVAFHHLAHGNVRGARSLMHEGRSRLEAMSPSTLPALDLSALVAATAPWDSTAPVPTAAPPALELRLGEK